MLKAHFYIILYEKQSSDIVLDINIYLKDYMIFADVKITNHTDMMMPFTIRTSILEARGEYDPYNLPFVCKFMCLLILKFISAFFVRAKTK